MLRLPFLDELCLLSVLAQLRKPCTCEEDVIDNVWCRLSNLTNVKGYCGGEMLTCLIDLLISVEYDTNGRLYKGVQ